MGLPVCVIRRHNFLAALSVMGVAPETDGFPAKAVCPKCQQNALRIFDDILTDGLWLSCDACTAHGDIITFAAHFWNINLIETFEKFVDTGLINENEANHTIAEYERQNRRQAAAEAFWADAESQVWNHGNDLIACHLRELGLRHEVREHYGLVGVTHPDQIDKICEAVGRQKPRRVSRDDPSIVFPFYDLPGRLSGFLFRQYTEFNAARQMFVALSGRRKQPSEAGYFMLNTALSGEHAVLKDTQIISDNPLWALKTQCRHLLKNTTPLPLLASHSSPAGESYGATLLGMPPATRIFHGVALSPELISRACLARGYVSNALIKHKPPMVDITAIRAGAKTWQDALASAIVGVPDTAAEAFAKRLTIPHDKLHAFFNRHAEQFSEDFRGRVLSAIKLARAAPTKHIREQSVVVRDGGWWTHSGRKICNIQPVITEVVQFDDGTSVYRGTIQAENNTYDFTVEAITLERLGLFGYARTILAPLGFLVVFDRIRNAQSTMLAMQLYPPKITALSAQLGWDAQTNTFRFAQYELTNAGAVRRTPPLPNTPRNKDFAEPTPIAPLPLHNLLTPAHENSIVWVITAGVLANLLAPALQKDYEAICVDNSDEIIARRVAAVLGCDTETIPLTCGHGNFIRKVNKLTADITWPIVCRGLFDDEMLGLCAPRFFNRALFICGRATTCAALAGYGWTSLRASTTTPTTDVAALRDVLPAYLQHVLQSKSTMFRTSARLVPSVLANLHTWLTTVYGAAFNLPHAQGLFQLAEHAHYAVMREIGAAIAAGQIDVLPQPRARNRPINYFVLKKDQIWLNRRAIERYFYVVRSPAPNWPAVITLLQQDNVYIDERNENGNPGVTVPLSWFEQFWPQNKRPRTKEIG